MPPRRKSNDEANEDANTRPKKIQNRGHSSRPPGQVIRIEKTALDELNNKIEQYQDRERKKQQEVKNPVPAAELQEAAGKVVRAMLFKNREKPGHPVRRQELLDILKKEQHAKSSRNLQSLAIPAAQAMCCRVFGLEMVELHRETAGSAKGDGGSIEYVLKSMLPAVLLQEVVASGSPADSTRAFTIVVMALIHMEGGKIEQEHLWELLSNVGVKVGLKHPKWGVDPADELKKLENKRWLVTSKRRAGGADGTDQVFYERGEVAKDHITDAELQEFIDAEFEKGGMPSGAEAMGSGEEEAIELD